MLEPFHITFTHLIASLLHLTHGAVFIFSFCSSLPIEIETMGICLKLFLGIVGPAAMHEVSTEAMQQVE
jgi:hypothetical protein